MKKQALNWAQNETMVVYFATEMRIFRTTPFFFIHPVYFESLRFSYELKLRAVFKQFSANLNLKFLSETLPSPRFPTIYQKHKKRKPSRISCHVVLYTMSMAMQFTGITALYTMQRIKLFQCRICPVISFV
jgi:hypothetical protein